MSHSQSTAFASDVLKIVSGTTIAQIIVMLSSPILTRLYGPEAFGILGIFSSITTIIGVIACLSLNYAILLPKEDEDAVNLLGMSFIVVAIVTSLTLPIVYFGGDLIAGLLGAPELGPSLILVPPFVFVSGLFLALNSWNSRTKHFGRLAVAQVTQSFASTGIRLGSGFSGYTTGGSLIGAQVVGSLVSTGILGGQIWRDDHVLLRRSISWKGMLEVLNRYRKFPLIDSGSRFLNAVSWQLPVFLLAAFFSPEIAGFYTLGFMVFQMPMSLIGSSIAKVFLQRASVARFDGTLSILVENVFRVLVIVGVFPFLAITLLGPELFSVIFGEVWAEAGLYSQILGLWAFVWFLASPISALYAVLEKQEFGLQVHAMNFVTRLVSLIIGALMGSPIIALLLFAGSGLFVYGYLTLKLMFYSGVKLVQVKKHLFRCFKLLSPFVITLIVLKILEVESILLVITACILGLVYYIHIVRTDSQVKSLIAGLTLHK
ncbi:lipopolysaccharide biosynthesis protein [Methanoculleus sp. FWC-SCC3]|uniref:Lipopolysaccharide biosynthesis protein n=1 Tax=Methanoculleus methanifontis TaxID=2584086 RepID=A0ABT8M5H0_9EURY|nr:oligosaccharide flippase family protein [Methanoculleus sp. FWC-SCC3]MDN7013858.1 lipopolysaccharide biosynthesis protein [Methanoculleus sp. FWC-SCC3]